MNIQNLGITNKQVILGVLLVVGLVFPLVSFAQPVSSPTPINCGEVTGVSGDVNVLLAPVCAFRQIPSGIAFFITISMIFGAIASLGALLYGGMLYATAQDKPNQLEQARMTIIWSVIGVLIISAAFSLFQWILPALGFDIFGMGSNKVYAQTIDENTTLVQLRGSVRNEEGELLPGVLVTLHWQGASGWEVWPAQQYQNQRNPYRADSFGQYQFYVPSGQYRVEVQETGYHKVETDLVEVSSLPIKVDITLSAAPVLWNYLLLVGIPLLLGVGVFFSSKQLVKWRDKMALRRQVLNELKKK